MTRKGRGAAVALLVLGAATAARGEERSLAEGLRIVARALALSAVTGGEAQVPPGDGAERLGALLREVADAPRAGDIRGVGDDHALRAALLDELLADGLGRRLDAFTGDAARRLGRELQGVVRRVESAASAADAALAAAKDGTLVSQRALRGAELGGTLLGWGAEAPLLTALLAADAPDRLLLLRRLTGHPGDPGATHALRLITAGAGLDPGLLNAVGGAAGVARAAQAVTGQLDDALATARQAVERAADVYRRIRQEELSRVVRGSREYVVQEAVPLLIAYRRQFRAAPTQVTALPWRDVYQDRARSALLFWHADEQRWSEASAEGPLDPVVAALIGSGDPRLARLASRARALEVVHGLFGPEQSFEAGLAEVEAAARSAAGRVGAVFEAGRAAGRSAADVDLALAAVLGVPTALFAGGAPEAAAAEVRALLLRTAIDQGRATARAQAQRIRGLPERLSGLRALPVRVTLEGVPAGGVDLTWRPAPEDDAWLVPPPTELAGGAGLAGGLLLVDVGGGRPQVGVVGVARAAQGDEAWGGVIIVRPPDPAALSLAPLSAGVLSARRVAGPDGPGLAVRQLAPATPLELWLVGPGGFERPLTPTPDGGLLVPSARDPVSGVAIEARFPDGRVGARLPVPRALLERDGVVTGEERARQWRVAHDETVVARVLRGGQPVPGERRFAVAVAGERVGEGVGDVLSWRGDLPLGRHAVAADRAGVTPLAVDPRPPQVVAARSRLGPGLDEVAPGEVVLLRVEAWPTLLPEELLEVRWRIDGGAAEVRGRTRARAGEPDAAGALAVRIDAGAAAGPRRVTAEVLTRRGRLQVEGAFAVTEPGRAVTPRLVVAGERRSPAAMALDEAGVVQLEAALSQAAWSLIGPQGAVRELVAPSPAVANLAFALTDPEGAYRVVVSGRDADGQRVRADLELVAYRAADLRLEPPSDRVVGKQASIRVIPPEGFEGPFRVRVSGGEWLDGARVTARIEPQNSIAVRLADARGRQARGVLEFVGEEPEGAAGVRYGVVADASERAVVPVDHATLQAFVARGTLPGDWVVLEPGPLGPLTVRDRLFAAAPYDGPSERSQAAYRSVRLWDGFQQAPRARLIELGVAPGTPFDVQDFPVPEGEPSLSDLAARLVAERGGFRLRRTSVRVRADGLVPDPSLPDDPSVVARFLRRGVSEVGGDVRRVDVPGPLADLRVVADLPEALELDRTHRLLFSAAAERHPLIPRHPYPDRWERLAPHALVCPELEVEVALEGWKGEVTARRIGRASAGVEVGLALIHQGTLRDTARLGSPRTGERYAIELAPLDRTASPSPSEVVFGAIPPGRLANEVRRLTIRVRATQRRAVPARAWPAGRPAPAAVTVDGAPFLFEDRSLAEATCELLVVYERVADDGPALAEPGAPLGALGVGGDLAPLGEADALVDAAAEARLGKRLDAAERAARRALAAAPRSPEPFALLADVAQARLRPGDARALASWSNALAPTARAHLVLAEAAWTEGEVEQAQAELDAARALDLDPELARRAAALADEMR